MKEFDLFGFQVEIDEVATKEWYEKADEWGCECEADILQIWQKRKNYQQLYQIYWSSLELYRRKLPMFVK